VKNTIIRSNGSDLCDSGVGTASASNLTTDPSFVNAVAADFHLQSTSPAINTGMTLTTVTNDFDNVPRPQGNRYDIGAYEFVSTPTRPVPPSGLRIVQ
jgi:hypothetical protein